MDLSFHKALRKTDEHQKQNETEIWSLPKWSRELQENQSKHFAKKPLGNNPHGWDRDYEFPFESLASISLHYLICYVP